MKCPRCQQENSSQVRLCTACGARLAVRAKRQRAEAKAHLPVSRKAPKNEDSRIRDLEKRLAESLEREKAAGEIQRVISSSPASVQPTFEAIARAAMSLCEADVGSLFRFDGQLIHLGAFHGTPKEVEASRRAFPQRPGHGSVTARAILAATVVQIDDVSKDPEAVDALRAFRTVLSVPMIRDGRSLGAITVARRVVRPFSDNQIALLKTFADQAVIAIENVRLFKELEQRNRDLTQSLEQQTATAEILRVISSSPTDVQPVFDTIVQSAARLCHAASAGVFLTDGRTLDLPANYGSSSPEALATIRAHYPRPLDLETTAGVAILTRSVIHVSDIEAPSTAEVYTRRIGRLLGVRSMVAVPMMRKGKVVGAINLSRQEPGRFSDGEVELLQTFADQAVIAIENVRLFKELEARNRDLTDSLEQQTATSDILRVISSSPKDLQPVFDTIVASAVRLLGGYNGALTRLAGDQVVLVAITSPDEADAAAVRAFFPRSLQSGGAHAQAIRDKTPFNIADFETDSRVPQSALKASRARGYRSVVAVPLLRHNEALGAIGVSRREAGGFTDAEIALLQTFADQAVIAIENARLLNELQARTQELTRSVGELTALGEVGRALSSTLDVDVVLDTIVTRANDLIGADGCTIFEYDEVTEHFHLRATRNLEPRLVELARGTPLRKGDQGILGHLPMGRRAVQVPDITAGSYSSPISDALIEAGYRAVVAVPLIREDRLIGALTMNRKTPGEFPAETIELLQTFATQSALAIQNARLFREIEIKSRELEVASQHKSEFLANMSHELRTPLNAVIGFSEVLSEGMFGQLNEKQEEYARDIYSSGQHLLSLINDILDLSKIEAGRMELELTDFDLPTAVDNALTLVRERASRRGVALHQAVDPRLGQIRGDERKIKQVLLNLLSNALKFTPEGGRIDVRAGLGDRVAEISVADTGVGIAPEDQEAIFEEFKQVGTAAKKVEGTGLGLALSRKFIELHGGRIWVKSQVGQGSTFTFTIPVRHGE